MPTIHNVLETCLYVDDLPAAEQFYADVLGLPLVSKDADRHLFFKCGDRMLLLFDPASTSELDDDPESAPPHGAKGAGHVCFSIPADALPEWRAHLASHDVPVEKELQWGDRGRSIYFRDPAGNSLEVASPAIWGIE